MDEQQKDELKNKALEWGKVAGKIALGAGKLALQGAKAAATEVGKVVDDLDKKAREGADLEKLQNTWYSNQSAPLLFEAIYKQFATKPLGSGQYRWCSIKPVNAYMQIVFNASWQHENAIAGSFQNLTELHMTLTIEQLDDGRSSATVDYLSQSNNVMNADPFASQLIKNTNGWIKALCQTE